MNVRRETPADRAAVFEINHLAFGREAEARLVDALRASGFARVSLVAELGGEITGHVLFSRLPIHTTTGMIEALAPLAVRPSYQCQGIGTRLVAEGLQTCRDAGHRIVIVLGHPDFYSRFGFSSHLASSLSSPFGGGDSWMAAELVPGALAGAAGRVEYPAPFAAF